MPLDAAGLRFIIRSEGAALLQQMDQVTDTQWSAPTVCTDWDVLDLLVHLHLGTQLNHRMAQNGLAGRNEPPFELPPGKDPFAAFKPIRDQARSAGPASNLAGLRAALDVYGETLAGLDDEQLERPAWFFSGPAPLARIIGSRAFDLIVHATDFRRAVGIEPWFSPAGARFAGELASDSLSRFFVAERAGGATGGVLQTIDDLPRQATLEPSGLRVGPPDGKHVASLSTDGGTWALLTWGRLSVAEAESRGLLTVAGNHDLVERYIGAMVTP